MEKKTRNQGDGKADSVVASYSYQLQAFPVLSHEDAKAAGIIIQTRPGTPEAKAAFDRLVCGNLRLVICIAKSFDRGLLPFEDLVAEGNLGLIQAVQRYNPLQFSNRFSTYATYWIANFVREANRKAATIRLPAKCLQQLGRIHSVGGGGADGAPNEEKLARETGLDLQIVKRCLNAPRYPVRLNQGGGGGDEGEAAFDVPDEAADTVAGIIEAEKKDALLAAMAACLKPPEAAIVLRAFGIGCEVATRRQLAEEFGITTQAINARIKSALFKIRRRWLRTEGE